MLRAENGAPEFAGIEVDGRGLIERHRDPLGGWLGEQVEVAVGSLVGGPCVELLVRERAEALLEVFCALVSITQEEPDVRVAHGLFTLGVAVPVTGIGHLRRGLRRGDRHDQDCPIRIIRMMERRRDRDLQWRADPAASHLGDPVCEPLERSSDDVMGLVLDTDDQDTTVNAQ
ncbi:hypothetical protein HDA39_007361 [Kribbella italica]|uniref:Uncharacterized protein n=1 Tax=Kribbella italica TaxID=1540520 RepID=A0A7W9JF20_9ACTN|nr:hypothetical protein [Kribbella italica]MBB5840627.1 hypothetical protein [Kribbella italica]